jgi:5-amino-6-(5-phosphoribosylamino)uracil reductase
LTEPARPYVLLSCATSLDGYIDDNTGQRLVLSNDEDFDRVDAVRATCDAILVGANTIRRDNPRLLIRSSTRSQERLAAGRAASPIKVTITSGTDLNPDAKFFTVGDVEKIVYTTDDNTSAATDRLGKVATVVPAGAPLDPAAVLADLHHRGMKRIVVEGGTSTHTLFLTHALADELHLVIAPFLVGDPTAPRFTGPGAYPQAPTAPARLLENRAIGDRVLLRYALTDRALGP